MDNLQMILVTPIVLTPLLLLIGLGLSLAIPDDRFNRKLSKVGGWVVVILSTYTMIYIITRALFKFFN